MYADDADLACTYEIIFMYIGQGRLVMSLYQERSFLLKKKKKGGYNIGG